MKIATSIVALALVAAVMAPQAVNGDTVRVKVRSSDVSDFLQFLPPLPAEVPWLTVNSRTPAKKITTLPEAAAVLLLVPKPAETWNPLPSQSAAAASPFVGM